MIDDVIFSGGTSQPAATPTTIEIIEMISTNGSREVARGTAPTGDVATRALYSIGRRLSGVCFVETRACGTKDVESN